MNKRFAHIPEETEFAAINIIPVALKQPERDVITFRRPAFAVIIAIFEHKMTKAVHASERILSPQQNMVKFHLPHIIGVVIVEDVDAARRNRAGVRCQVSLLRRESFGGQAGVGCQLAGVRCRLEDAGALSITA